MKSPSLPALVSLLTTVSALSLGAGCAAPMDDDDAASSAAAIESDCRKSANDPVTTQTAREIARCLVARGTTTDAAGTIASLFDSPTLNYNFATDFTAGGRPASRLDFVLDFTNSGQTGFTQFSGGFATDTGFATALRDGFLYTNKWGGSSNQSGHFLTAIAMAYNPDSVKGFVTLFMGREISEDPRLSALRMMVGHEMLGDNSAGSMAANAKAQYQKATTTEVGYFVTAAKYDRLGRPADRDRELMKILVAAGYSATSDAACTAATCSSPTTCACTWQQGNSLHDLRLTLKGVRFGQKVAASRRNAPDAYRHRGMYDGLSGYADLDETPFSESGRIEDNLRAVADWLRANIK